METELTFTTAEQEALDKEDRQLTTRDNLVRILDDETTIELFFMCKSSPGLVYIYTHPEASQYEKKRSGGMDASKKWWWACWDDLGRVLGALLVVTWKGLSLGQDSSPTYKSLPSSIQRQAAKRCSRKNDDSTKGR
jgi:hypothetical protein